MRPVTFIRWEMFSLVVLGTKNTFISLMVMFFPENKGIFDETGDFHSLGNV